MATLNTSNGQLEFKIGNRTEFYQFQKLSNVTWVLNNDGKYYILLTYEDDYFVKIELTDITNQPAWTNDLAGAEQAVKDISTWIGLAVAPSVGLATEATLLNVLTAVDNMRDYEVRLVVDSDVTPVTWLEVRYWDAQSGTLGTPQYYLPGSTTAGSPVLPISYINDQTLLSQILAELQSTLDVNITNAAVTVNGTVAVTQSTSPWVVSGTVNIGTMPEVEIKNDSGNPIPVNGTVTITDGSGPVTVDGTVSATQSGTWNINNITGTVSLPTGAATEVTLALVNSNTVLGNLTLNAIDTKLTPTVRTHNTVSATGSGSVPAGSLRGSVLNVGSAAGTWNGISLPAGVAIPWDAVGPRDTYGAIAYDATGTTFIIEYTT